MTDTLSIYKSRANGCLTTIVFQDDTKRVLVEFSYSILSYDIIDYVKTAIKQLYNDHDNIVISTNLMPYSEQHFTREEINDLITDLSLLIKILSRTNFIFY